VSLTHKLHRLFEPEETVGALWHGAAERMTREARYPEAAVQLSAERARLAVFFRGLGGAGGVELRAIRAMQSAHRMGWLGRMARQAERVTSAQFDGVVLGLPETVDAFPERRLNSDLLLWLAALSAFSEPARRDAGDELQRDLQALRQLHAAVTRALFICPGLVRIYADLARAALDHRQMPALPEGEREVEAAIVELLSAAADRREPAREASPMLPAILGSGVESVAGFEAPVGYKPFRPVAVWPVLDAPPAAAPRAGTREDEAGQGGSDGGEKRMKAERRKGDQADRRDSLILHRFEHILSWAEFLNINRAVDDDEEDSARKVADDADKVSIVKNRKKAATRLKFDLDLAPEDVDRERLSGTTLYPEWDYRRGLYHVDHCRVLESIAEEAPEGLKLDGPARRRVQSVRRRFEALRPKRTNLPRQIDGHEVDLDAAVRTAIDIRACGEGSDRVWRSCRDDQRDLAVGVLMDTSRSTESACGQRRVIDVAREALVALVEGIAACGDAISVQSFSSLRRDRVYIRRVKGFDERVDDAVRARIAGLRPGFYTRIGPAIRHAAAGLVKHPSRKKLLLVLTDGKPNDLDYYEGRYGIEDTRRAVLEARRAGLAVFGVTVDSRARSYFPYMFGASGFAIVPRPEKLGEALPIVWQHLVE